MSDFYLARQASAARVIAERGREMTLKRRTPGTYNPATGASAVATTDYACMGVTIAYPALLIDGTRVQVGDTQVLLSAQGLAVEPDTSDQILIGAALHSIVKVQPVAPDGTVVVWKLQVRR